MAEQVNPPPENHYACINCSHPVTELYITYNDPGNTSLRKCPACGDVLDVYTTLTFPVLLVDLLLCKTRCYRHLLINRGSADPAQRIRDRASLMWRLGALVIGLDASIRCAHVGPPASLAPFRLFAKTLGYCLLETLSLHACIALASAFSIMLSKQASNTRSLTALRDLPLTLFYTSIPTLFLLTITSLIWRAEYAAAPSPSADPSAEASLEELLGPLGSFPLLVPTLRKLNWLSRERLKSGITRVGDTSGWANESILRKGVGGSSAVVGLSALLNTSKRRTIAILLLAWTLHLAVLNAVDPLLT